MVYFLGNMFEIYYSTRFMCIPLIVKAQDELSRKRAQYGYLQYGCLLLNIFKKSTMALKSYLYFVFSVSFSIFLEPTSDGRSYQALQGQIFAAPFVFCWYIQNTWDSDRTLGLLSNEYLGSTCAFLGGRSKVRSSHSNVSYWALKSLYR